MASNTQRQLTGPLQGSFLGLLKPVPFLLSNSYPGITWPNLETCKLDNEKDVANLERWAFRGIPGIEGYTNRDVKTKTMREILGRRCGQVPTILYVGGHTMPDQERETYMTADCCKRNEQVPSKGLAFQDMYDLLVSNPATSSLLIVTDACGFTNFLELPFVFFPDGENGRWEKTKHCSPEGWGKDQSVLHMASSAPGELSFEFKSRGGLFTSEFCEVPLAADLTLGQRFTQIQQGIDKFLLEHSSMKKVVPHLTQRPQIYSSSKFDLSDKCLFQRLGFCSRAE